MSTDPTPCSRPAQAPAPSCLPPVGAGRQAASGGIPADQLFQGRQEILINHNGEIYRLRITRNSKLILTK